MAIAKLTFGQKELRTLLTVLVSGVLAVLSAIGYILSSNLIFIIPMIIFIIVALVFLSFYLLDVVKGTKVSKTSKKEEPKTETKKEDPKPVASTQKA